MASEKRRKSLRCFLYSIALFLFYVLTSITFTWLDGFIPAGSGTSNLPIVLICLVLILVMLLLFAGVIFYLVASGYYLIDSFFETRP